MGSKKFKIVDDWFRNSISTLTLTVDYDGLKIWFYIEPNSCISILKPVYKEPNDFYIVCSKLIKSQPKFANMDDARDYTNRLLNRASKLILYS